MIANEQLMKKWQPILEHADAPQIADAQRRTVVAQLLENQEWAQKEQSEALTDLHEAGTGAASDNPANVSPMNSATQIAKYDPIMISLVRRSVPNLIAFDVMGVQPMTGPTGLIFALRPKYIKVAADGAKTFGDRRPFYDEPDVNHSGDVTAAAGSTGPEGTDPGVLAAAFDGVQPGEPTDPAGVGYDIGKPMSTADGEQLGTAEGSHWQEMGFEIDKVAVQAKTRALKAQYTVELAQDLKNVHGLNAEAELANILSTEIMAEINREVIRTIYNSAVIGCQQPDLHGKGGRGTDVSFTSDAGGYYHLDKDSNGRWAVEKFKGLMFQLEREANKIAQDTRRGKGNIIICSADVASALSMAGMLDSTPALSDSLNVDPSGNTYVGVLNGRFKVYVDPYHSGQEYVVMGYKGQSTFDAGMFYAPYVPLQLYKATGEDSFQPRMGFKTRYGMVANPFSQDAYPGTGTSAKYNEYFENSPRYTQGQSDLLDGAYPQSTSNNNVYYRKMRVVGISGNAGS